MEKKKLFKTTSFIAALVGVGMILGHNLSTGTSNNGLWVGGLLVLLAAVLFGMAISSPTKKEKAEDKSHTPTSEN